MARKAGFLVLLLLLSASCGVSRTTSGFVLGDRPLPADFPKRAVVYLCEADTSLRPDVIEALTGAMAGVGIRVLDGGKVRGMERICSGEGFSQGNGEALRDNMGVEGIFVGNFTQRRVEPLLLTRFELKLIGNPSGALIWSTKVETDHLASTANVKTIGVRVAEMAVESLRGDLFAKAKGKK